MTLFYDLLCSQIKLAARARITGPPKTVAPKSGMANQEAGQKLASKAVTTPARSSDQPEKTLASYHKVGFARVRGVRKP